MEDITLDFFGEKVKINKPKDLSYLRILISEKFMLSDIDAAEILIYYLKDNKKKYIINDDDYQIFWNLKIATIFLDIDKNSKLYLENKLKLEKENSSKSNENSELEKLIQKKQEIEKSEEEYLKSYKEKLTNLNRQIDILLAKKLDLVTLKKNKLKDFRSQKEKIDKKINELSENKENKDVLLKTVQKSKNKEEENNILSFNKLKIVLDNVVEKVKDVTNEYIFKNFEKSKKEEKIDNIKKTTKDAIKEINNLSKLVINQSNNLIEEINENEGEKIILRGTAKKLGASEDDLCENCLNKSNHKLDHISIKIKEQEEESENTLKGVKCKGCGTIIWEEN